MYAPMCAQGSCTIIYLDVFLLMCNLNIVPNKTGSVLGMLRKFFNTTHLPVRACLRACVPPCALKLDLFPQAEAHMLPPFKWVSAHGQLTS